MKATKTYTITSEIELADGRTITDTLAGKTEAQIEVLRADYRAYAPTGSTQSLTVTAEN